MREGIFINFGVFSYFNGSLNRIELDDSNLLYCPK